MRKPKMHRILGYQSAKQHTHHYKDKFPYLRKQILSNSNRQHANHHWPTRYGFCNIHQSTLDESGSKRKELNDSGGKDGDKSNKHNIIFKITRMSSLQRGNWTAATMPSLRLIVVASMTAVVVAFTAHHPPMRVANNAPLSLFSTTVLQMSSSVDSDTTTFPNFNSVEVAKTGGQGMVTASQQAVAQDLSLGAPRGRPKGGHFMTKGGIQVTAHVEGLEYTRTGDMPSLANKNSSEAVIESLVQKLDSHKGVLLTSSYEFPGRYARWSLGFIDPPLEISGKANQCTIKALNDRGKVLLPAIEKAMQGMKTDEILSEVNVIVEEGEGSNMVQIDVTIVPPPPVGTFSEEERSRQVRIVISCVYIVPSLLFGAIN
jgi:hypothetical protein